MPIFALFLLSTDIDRLPAQFLLKSEFGTYKVALGEPRPIPRTTELEIGDGFGHGYHGHDLGWLRFVSENEGAKVLSVSLHVGFAPYKSKWPLDEVPVRVKMASMKSTQYTALLRSLSHIEAAKLTPVERLDLSFSFSSRDFWVNARFNSGKESKLVGDWIGYWGSLEEIRFAKPKAMVDMVRAAVKGLEFKERELTKDERRWASAKFVRDWKKFTSADEYWWVRQRYVNTIGVVGDQTALPLLREILSNPKGDCLYEAINAVTRLTKKDVRDRPVEEMDIEKNRKRVLELLPKD